MSTAYFDAVMADNPLGYWRLDKIGAATSGEEVEDSSGNDLHGTLNFGSQPDGFQPWGYALEIDGALVWTDDLVLE